MIRFADWHIQLDGALLARQYDNLSAALIVAGEIPDGWVWGMLVEAKENLNIIRLTEMEDGVGAILTDEMLAISGYYTMQLRGTQGETVKHTNKIQVFVPDSLSGNVQWPTIPSEFTQLEARVNADADRAEDAAQAAEDAAIRQPYPNPDTGTWWTWDAETGAYKDTGEPYSGGGSGEAGQDGGYYAPSVDDAGNLTWTPSKADMPPVAGANIKGPAGPQGPAGADGKDGAQGPQGEQGVQGPPGEKGDTGPQGEKGDKGDTGAQGPKGDTGETGPAGQTGATPNLQIGEVTTLDAGSDATASITGTPENPLLNLGIPKGADGGGGIGDGWEKFVDMTLEENVASVTLDLPGKYKRLYFVMCLNSVSGSTAALDMRFSNSPGATRLQYSNYVHNVENRDCVFYVEKIPGYYPRIISGNNGGGGITEAQIFVSNNPNSKIDWAEVLGSLTMYATGTEFAAGSTIKIWGAE